MENEDEKYSSSLVSVPRGYSRAHSPYMTTPVQQETKGKSRNWKQTLKVTLLLVTPMVILLGMTINAHVVAVKAQSSANTVKSAIKSSLEVAELVRMLQIERGRTSMYLSTNRENKHVYKQLQQNRADTTDKYKLVSDWSFVDIPQLTGTGIDDRSVAFSVYMGEFRNNADIGRITVTQSLRFFSELNAALVGTLFSQAQAPGSYKYLVAFDKFARAGEAAGIQRAIGAAFWVPCDYIESNKLWLIETHSDHGHMMDAAFRYYPPLQDNYYRIRSENRPLWQDIERMVEYLTTDGFRENCSSLSQDVRLQMGQDWFNNMTKYVNMLSDVREVLMVGMEQNLDQLVGDAKTKVVLYSFVLLLATTCAGATIYMVLSIFQLTAKLQQFGSNISRKTKEIEIEKERADSLLSQMLPPSVVDDLKLGFTPAPEFFDEITVYFSDIVGFSDISSRSTPHDIIDLLNLIYGLFDETIEKFDVYKVETIGDAYMVASGVPIKNGDQHVVEIARLSIQLLRLMTNMQVPHLLDETIRLRIGLNSGPCAAGVVGVKMPRYCLFGDTINTASRMQSNGQESKIHISPNTRNLLVENKEFYLEEKGQTFIKGKGMMTTYWLYGGK